MGREKERERGRRERQRGTKRTRGIDTEQNTDETGWRGDRVGGGRARGRERERETER